MRSAPMLPRSTSRLLRAVAAGAVALLAGSVLTVGATAPAFAADPPSIVVALTETDGTGPFDAADGAGLDASASNGIVRVNDTMTYSVEVATNDAAATNTSFTLKLPQGQEISGLPGYCLTGSSISPATLPNPAVPLTSTSYQSLPQQTIVCVVGARTSNSTVTYPLTVSVRSELPNGNVMGPVTASATADDVATPSVSNAVTTTASAKMSYDLSKNGEGPTSNSGQVSGPSYTPCPQDASAQCVAYQFPLTIAATTAGGKGSSPATSPITLTDAIDAASLFPSLTTTQLAAINADPAKYGTTLNCNPTTNMNNTPNPSGGGTGAVRNSGTLTCDQPSGPGTPVNLTLTNTDTSLKTYPTLNNNSSAIPANQAYIVSKSVIVNVPRALFLDFAPVVGGLPTLAYKNTYTNFHAVGLDGSVQTSADQPAFNDYRQGTMAGTINATGPSMSKIFAGEPGNAANTGKTGTGSYIGGGVLSGPPGGWSAQSGQIRVGDGQTVTSVLAFVGANANVPVEESAIGCDVWDPSKLQLQAKNYLADSQAEQAIAPGHSTAVWLSGFRPAGTWLNNAQAATATLPSYSVEYSSGAIGNGAATNCSTGTWYSDPSQVPGNDPTLASQGVYTAVNKVRIYTTLPAPTTTSNVPVAFSIGMRVVSGLPEGTVLPNYAGFLPSLTLQTQAQMLAGSGTWTTSTYNAGTNAADGNTGAYGDRLLTAPYYVRLTKLVKGPNQTSFGTTPPAVTGGNTVQYQLSPTINSAAPSPTGSADVWVEDCLPAGQTYSTASVTPTVVSVGSTPADAQIAACATGATYLRWDLGQRGINQAITPIVLSVKIGNGLATGSYNNTAQVWAPADGSSVALRSSSAQISVTNPSGVALDKVALTPQIQVNRPGQATNQQASWLLTLTNNNSVNPLSNPDLVDVLPVNGANGTAYSGNLAFDSASVVAGGATLQYTSSTGVESDPNAASNGATGSTTWCTQPAGGTTVSGTGSCPTSAAAVTGVRVVRAGAFVSGDSIQVQVNMTAVGDTAGDVFVNTVAARVTGQALGVGPASAPVTVVSSSLGDFVWNDVPDTGIQTSGSVGVAGFPVSVAGTDDLGNAVTASTVTDSSGHYSIPGLRAGTYTVTFAPSGLQAWQRFSPQGQGTDPTVDSNGDPVTGVSAAVVLPQNTSNTTIDQGIHTIVGDLAVSKAIVDAAPATPGRATTFPVTVSCLAPGQTTPVVSNLTLSADGTPVSVTGMIVGTVCTITETNTDGATASITGDGTVTIAEGANTATVTNTYPEPVYTVKKTASAATVKAGDPVTYTIVVTNPTSAAVSASFSDDLSAVLDDAVYNDDATNGATVAGQALSWAGTVPANGSVTITYSVTTNNPATGDGVLTNAVTPTGPGGGCATDADCTTATKVIGDLAVSKVIVDNAPTTPGRATSFPVDVSCFAPGAPAPLVSHLSLSADGTPSTIRNLAIGTVCTITETGTDGATATVTNDGTVTIDAAANTATVTNTYPDAAFTVKKTASTSTVKVGDSVTYTVVVTNPTSAVVSAGFTDDLSAVLDDATYNGDATGGATVSGSTLNWSGTVPANGTVTITYSVTTIDPATGDGVLTNAVIPVGPGGTCATVADCTTTTTEFGDLAISKTIVDAAPTTPGRATSFPVTVSCLAPGATTPVVSQISILASGEPVTISNIAVGTVCTITETNTDGATATITGDGTATINTALSEVTVTNTYPEPAFTVAKSVSAEQVKVGDPVTYTIVVTNPTSATVSAAISDDLSAVLDDATYNDDATNGATVTDGILSWSGTVPANGTVTITYSVTTNTPATGDGVLTNTVIPVGPGGECVADGDCTTTTTEVGDLAISKVIVDAAPETPGRATSFPVELSCLAPGASEPTVGEITILATGEPVTIENLLVGTVCTIVETNTDGATATITGDGTVTIDMALSAVTVTNTYPEPAFTVAKTASAAETALGDVVTYSIVVTNPTTAAVSAGFSDDLSAVLDDATYNGDVTNGATVEGATLTWAGTLPAESSVTITYSVTVADPATGDGVLTNTVVPVGDGGTCAIEGGCVTTTTVTTTPTPTPAAPVAGPSVHTGGSMLTGPDSTGWLVLAGTGLALAIALAVLGLRRRRQES